MCDVPSTAFFYRDFAECFPRIVQGILIFL